MPSIPRTAIHPRKQPVQSRSADTVGAILDATLQVLTRAGKERLTTTRVATRAGVSVGTLYQYFPNKVALLQACLQRHMRDVIRAVEETCAERHGDDLLQMADAIIDVYFKAKLEHMTNSVALYSISSDVDGMQIAKDSYAELRCAVAAMFATAPCLSKDPQTVATVVLSAMNGIARRLLESAAPEQDYGPLKGELTLLVHSYLRASMA